MSTTFPCPHCGQTYPIKPVLIGKVVRCTGCKNPFRLREDGIADIVNAEPAPAPAPAPAPTRPPEPPAAPVSEAVKPSTARRTAADEAKAQEIKERMAEARKAMAADLAQAAGKALQSSTVKDEETSTRRQGSSRMRAVASAGAEGGKRTLSPAILTGEGEREAANTRLWVILGVVAVVLAIAIGWLLTLDGPRTTAIESFTATVPADQNTYGVRDVAISNRGWLTAESGAVTPFIDLGSIRWGRTVTVTPAAYSVALGRLAQHVPLKGTTLWVPAKELAKAEATLTAGSKETADKRLLAARVPFLAWSTIAKDLATSGCDEATCDALHLLLSHVPAPNATDLGKALVAGSLTFDLQVISGAHGMYLQDLGGSYRTPSSPWEGLLLRTGNSPWRFLRLAPVHR